MPGATIDSVKSHGEEMINKMNDDRLTETIKSQGEITFNGYKAYKFDLVDTFSDGTVFDAQDIYLIGNSDRVLYIHTFVNENIAADRAADIQAVPDTFEFIEK